VLAAMAAITLGGCASPSLSIRSLPPETPEADVGAAAENAATLAAAIQSEDSGGHAPAAAGPPLTAAEAPSMRTYDPWERLNRFTYRFNARFDEAIFLPVANGYRRLPSPLRAGVHNFFGNLTEVDSIINYVLQVRLQAGVRSLGRFLINSTFGIGGLIDVAAKLKLPDAPTGFSATLSTWGMHPGPYLVIPIIGPSTLRDGIGLAGDFGAAYAVNVVNLYRGNKTWYLGVVNGVDERANVDFRYYATGSPFEYETIRFLYVRKRLIEDEGLRRKSRPKKAGTGAPAGE